MKSTVNQQILVGNVGSVTFPSAKLGMITLATVGFNGVTEWHDVKVISERLCKLANEQIRKGQMVYVSGETVTDRWETRDGQKRAKKRVLANAIEILNWGSSEEEKNSTAKGKKS